VGSIRKNLSPPFMKYVFKEDCHNLPSMLLKGDNLLIYPLVHIPYTELSFKNKNKKQTN
jgi:hypothetical protein